MADFFKDEDSRVWARDETNKGYLNVLVATLRRRADGHLSLAAEKGDTDFEKGYYRALKIVCDDINRVLSDTETATVISRHGNGNGQGA